MKNSKFQSLISFAKTNEYKLSFLFILLFSTSITVLLIWINTSQDILGHSYRDVYFYLIEALRFSGHSIGGYDYVNYLSPLIPFLTSLLFRLGFVNETSIFTVTGIFYILGVLGVYSLLKIRFKNLMAVFGAIIYAGFSINLMWVANGTIDVPSVSLTILSIYFFVLGVEKNQKYFYLAFPLAVLGFFAKYTAGLAIPLMILYLISKPNISYNIKKYSKNGIIGILAGVIMAIPFLAHFYINKIPLGFVNQAQDIASKTSTLPDVNNNLFYYFTNIPRFIYNPNHILSYIIIVIIIIGLLIGLYKAINILKNRYDNSNKFNNGKIKLMGKNTSNILVYVLLAINIILIALSFLTASKISFVYSELILFVSLFTFSYISNKIINIYSNKTKKFFNFDLLMFAWFLSYMIFFSAHLVKADRYFTTLAPTFAFIATLSLSFILNSLDSLDSLGSLDSLISLKLSKVMKAKNIGLIKTLIPIVIIILFVISSFAYLTIDKHDSIVDNEKEVVNWLKVYDPNYDNKVIWAERGPIFTWYLQKEVLYVKWLTSPNELSTMMLANNTTYFISIHKKTNINGYLPVKEIGEVIVYKKTS
ncbi:glycosyltransferase family 39 protein [Methanobrevibacter sp. TMH8]|uniref:glycosyltransferase family 39 protein n=1 Tax=Methanobrevibacter sp. TMH8 TaxID=2848611 RepID=UPI001CCB0710|nr:glycosyltransferase family 39 protein [Methanobrevibacter sp. TMH8]MBZ9571045.1 glycosyltransferase family 39 protein [Methanobrevibacter sp. TMH8]